jgi:hypothetical protein
MNTGAAAVIPSPLFERNVMKTVIELMQQIDWPRMFKHVFYFGCVLCSSTVYHGYFNADGDDGGAHDH